MFSIARLSTKKKREERNVGKAAERKSSEIFVIGRENCLEMIEANHLVGWHRICPDLIKTEMKRNTRTTTLQNTK